ncbi:pancreatic triacylglycerol lipase-like [Macrosteles quadrilineatus]|uniref:pancreatic triacylglycerol lipase-like n=1 Tax=Macrosteles quadrilineatus TaxID=74068 RepID=UPI0023E091A5|nr:pancreatic triacylglycerol lipase-like [Macrosteles quadrilineatus]
MNQMCACVADVELDMALDLLGGMYHCVFSSFVEAKPEDVHFHLYTRKNPEEPEELFLPQEQPLDNVTDNTNIPKPVLEEELKTEIPYNKREIENEEDYYEDDEFEPLNPAKSSIQSKWFNVFSETKVLIHGYLQDYQTDVMVSMKDAYLSRGPYNVVVVDWSVLVGESSCYPIVASRGLQQVGGLLAQLLDHLVYAGVSPSNIHIVGFSLGAHVAGHAGTFLGHGLVSRITGLDPALPYVPMENDVSLDAGDAVFVDIIHSAAGLLGQSGPMGHIDFYPNGGSQQPGCEVSSLSCSHRRAALYFIESITSEVGFPATRCDSWHHYQTDNCSISATVLMGDPCPANASGKFYLVTGYKSPFVLQPEEHVQVKKSLLLDLFYDSEDL